MSPEMMSSASGWLLTYLLHSSVLLGATWLVTRRWVASPHYRDLLWKAATIGGFLSASLQGWSGLEPIAGRLALPTGATVAPVSVAESPATGWVGLLPAESRGRVDAAPVLDRGAEATESSVDPGPSRGSVVPFHLPPVEMLLVALWALGAAVLGGLFVVQRRRAIRGLGHREPVS
ncbi:MAG: hypothetical protein E4H38_07240, partial [Gemmatimonadales bacterium]